MSHANLMCPNCGRELTGRFCADCGQAEHDGHPPTIRHFLHDLAHEFLHVDGRIFLTLKALFLDPAGSPKSTGPSILPHGCGPSAFF